MKIFCFFFLLLYVNNNFAQDSSIILIKADQFISDVLTQEKIYQYPKFSNGKVIFKDQRSMEAMLNYNYLDGEIEFIGPKKDTMTIAKHQMPTIQKIIVNNDTFYCDNGYLQQVLETPLGKLAKRKMLVILKIEKLGAYDRPTSTTRAETLPVFKDYFGSTSVPYLKSRENITMAYKNELFFGDKYDLFLPASKNNLIKLFPSKKEMISNYLKENDVNFKNSDDLKKLLLFLQ